MIGGIEPILLARCRMYGVQVATHDASSARAYDVHRTKPNTNHEVRRHDMNETSTTERSQQEIQEAEEHSEGRLARAIEQQTAKLPSDTFLWAAVGAMAAAALLELRQKRHLALFVGQWAAPLLLFGVYNKIVKTAGSDRAYGGNGSHPPHPGF